MLHGFEKAGSDVVLAEHRDVRDRADFGRSGLTRKVEHPFQGGQFAINGSVPCALL